jgi:tetratricopeptide (TPR) repeat protein
LGIRKIGYTRDEGYSLISVGVALEQLGDPAGAADAYRRAIELLETAYEESGMVRELSVKADALTLLGRIFHHSLDRPVEALNAYGAAAETYRELGDTHRLRKLLLGLAGLRWRMGDLEDCARTYEEALDLAREHGETVHEAVALASLSVAYRDLDRTRESLRCGRAALRLLRNLSDPQAEAYVLTSMAESYGRLGHYSSALSCLRRSLRLRRKMGDKAGEVRVLYALAKVYDNLEDAGRARAALEEAAQKEEAQEVTSVERGN